MTVTPACIDEITEIRLCRLKGMNPAEETNE